jgi:nicotinate-nucleotide adenylyltransferase
MGGTFDPIHIGHLVAAEEAHCQFQLDKVIFIPSARPHHKTDASHSPAGDRLRMVELAIEKNPYLEVSDMELTREGLSYTIDTLRELHVIYGAGAELFFITGADSMIEIMTWKKPAELLDEARFIVATRPGYVLADIERSLPEQTERGENPLESVYMMEIPGLDISSTDIRSRVASGRPFRYLVPDAVWQYIKAGGLYVKGLQD